MFRSCQSKDSGGKPTAPACNLKVGCQYRCGHNSMVPCNYRYRVGGKKCPCSLSPVRSWMNTCRVEGMINPRIRER
jgi:hypothetical protein